ncbi:MAG: acetylxylan esterase [Verrucomicrobiaceae bacterium]|nr:acetylxylan esterase [Verrucomicrobiaceae bacterium]
MIHRLLAFVALLPALVHAQTPLKAVTDRPDAVYSIGDEVTFTISGPAGEVTCVLSKDGVDSKPPQKLMVPDNGSVTLKGTLDEPGFLTLRVRQGETTTLAAAAISPEMITPVGPPPTDFDAFWDKQRTALKAVPLNPKMESVDAKVKGVEAFDIKVDCLGAPVSGYFGRPATKAAAKSLPAILYVHGAGVGSSNLTSVNWVLQHKGMLALDINAHGIENGKPKEFYEQLAATTLKDYRYVGRNDPEQCYFKGMFLRVIRAIDFLTSQPEWDGKTLVVYGSSQGGFQALAAAGLDSRVSFICAGVPAGCDHNGFEVGRVCGWPKLVAVGQDGKHDATGAKAAAYFDCINFALRAKCKGAAVTVGYIDTTCPPTSVYAAYNALNVPKSIHADPLVGHTNSPVATKFMQDAALKHIRGE